MSEKYENKTFAIFSHEAPKIPYIQIAEDKYLVSASDYDELDYPHVEVHIPAFDGFFAVIGTVKTDNLMKVYGYLQMWKKVTSTKDGHLVAGVCTNKDALRFFETHAIIENIQL